MSAAASMAMTGTVLLLAEVVVDGWVSITFGVVAGPGFATLWFVVPWRERGRDTVDAPEDPDSPIV